MDKKEIEVSGKKIVYRVGANGQPVVLIHGFGEESNVWKNQIAFFERKYKLIVPDLPGSGDSEVVNNMSMEGMAGVIKEILDHEKISSCTMIGHSMGGYIALAFAQAYSSLLTAFGLFHSTAFPDTEEKKAARRKGIEFMKEHGAFEFLKNTTPNLFSQKTRDENPEMVEAQINSLSNFSANTLVSYYESMINRIDRTSFLRSSTIPILFIAGKHDNAVPLDDIMKQCHLPSLSYIHILGNSAHLGMLEEPDKSNFILEKFLRNADETRQE